MADGKAHGSPHYMGFWSKDERSEDRTNGSKSPIVNSFCSQMMVDGSGKEVQSADRRQWFRVEGHIALDELKDDPD